MGEGELAQPKGDREMLRWREEGGPMERGRGLSLKVMTIITILTRDHVLQSPLDPDGKVRHKACLMGRKKKEDQCLTDFSSLRTQNV